HQPTQHHRRPDSKRPMRPGPPPAPGNDTGPWHEWDLDPTRTFGTEDAPAGRRSFGSDLGPALGAGEEDVHRGSHDPHNRGAEYHRCLMTAQAMMARDRSTLGRHMSTAGMIRIFLFYVGAGATGLSVDSAHSRATLVWVDPRVRGARDGGPPCESP